jgi:DNA-binding NarL/FixJ family response regulator
VTTAAATEERTKVARELHDNLAKSLQGIAMTATALPLQLERHPERAAESALSIREMAATAVHQVRGVMVDLRAKTSEGTLSAAAAQVVLGWAARTGRNPQLLIDDVDAAEEATRYELLSVLGESLDNVHRHAGPCEVTVELHEDQGFLSLAVRDTGAGFEPATLSAAQAAGHHGVDGMQERMARVGGWCTVTGAAGARNARAVSGAGAAPGGAMTVTVGVVDDSDIMRKGLLALLGTDPGLEVVGQAGDGDEALALVRAYRPDVLLLDVRMPRRDGLSIVSEIARQTRVLMLTFTDDDASIRRAMSDGAAGYLVHGTFDAESLAHMVRATASGAAPVSDVAMRAIQRGPVGCGARARSTTSASAPGRSRSWTSSPRVGATPTSPSTLFVAEKTVKNHINQIFAALGVSTRAEAIVGWLGR